MFGQTAKIFDIIPLRNTLSEIQQVCEEGVVTNGEDWPREAIDLIKQVALQAEEALNDERNRYNDFSKDFASNTDTVTGVGIADGADGDE